MKIMSPTVGERVEEKDNRGRAVKEEEDDKGHAVTKFMSAAKKFVTVAVGEGEGEHDDYVFRH